MEITTKLIRTLELRLKASFPAIPGEDICDAIMEAFLVFYEKKNKDDFVSVHQVCQWIYKTAYRYLLKLKTKKYREVNLDEMDNRFSYPEGMPDQDSKFKYETENNLDNQLTLEMLVEKLPLKYHECIENFYIQEYDVNLLAKIRGCKPDTLRHRRREAISRLKSMLYDIKSKK